MTPDAPIPDAAPVAWETRPAGPPRSALEGWSRPILLVLLLVGAAFLIPNLVPRGPTFPVGTCLAGTWSDSEGGEVGQVPCSGPHDYEVSAIASHPEDCPPGTVGRVTWDPGGLTIDQGYMCLRAAVSR